MSDAAGTNLPPEEPKLSELEEQVLAQFTNRESQADTSTEEAPIDSLAPAGTVDEQAPVTTSPVPGGEGGEEQAPAPPSGGEPAPTTPVEESAPTEEHTTPEIAWDTYPEPVEAEAQAKLLYDWHRQLTPQQAGAIDQALSGDYVLVRADQVSQLQEQYQRMEQWEQERAAAARRSPEQELIDPHLDPDEAGDPILAAQLQSTQAQIAQLQEQQMIQLLDQEVTAREQVIVAAQDNWLQAHPYLDETDIGALEDQITTSGIFPTLFEKYGAEQATRMAFEQAAAVIPRVSQKVMDARVAEQVAAGTQAVQAQQQNGTRASAIAGGATTPPDLSGMNSDDAMVEEIRRAMYG